MNKRARCLIDEALGKPAPDDLVILYKRIQYSLGVPYPLFIKISYSAINKGGFWENTSINAKV